jgi:hypothetical protein
LSTGCEESPAPSVHVLETSSLLSGDARGIAQELDEKDGPVETANQGDTDNSLGMWNSAKAGKEHLFNLR